MHAAEPQVRAGSSGLPCAIGFTAYTRSPRGPAFLPPCRDNAQARVALGISTGMPGPRDFTVRIVLFVCAIRSRCSPIRPSHPALNVRDDRDTPLWLRRDQLMKHQILEKRK